MEVSNNQYLKQLASDLGVSLGAAKHDLDVAARILDSIPGLKSAWRDKDAQHITWYPPKKFGRDYEVRGSTFVGCVIKLGNYYKGLLREREQVKENDEV